MLFCKRLAGGPPGAAPRARRAGPGRRRPGDHVRFARPVRPRAKHGRLPRGRVVLLLGAGRHGADADLHRPAVVIPVVRVDLDGGREARRGRRGEGTARQGGPRRRRETSAAGVEEERQGVRQHAVELGGALLRHVGPTGIDPLDQPGDAGLFDHVAEALLPVGEVVLVVPLLAADDGEDLGGEGLGRVGGIPLHQRPGQEVPGRGRTCRLGRNVVNGNPLAIALASPLAGSAKETRQMEFDLSALLAPELHHYCSAAHLRVQETTMLQGFMNRCALW